MAPKRKPISTPSPALSPRRTRSSGRLPLEAPSLPPAKRAKRGRGAVGSGERKVEIGEEPLKAAVVVEACKQCQAFKRTAMKVKEGLEKKIPGIEVTINPEKPRRGCFEVRSGAGVIFISLLNMKRPFGPMKALNLEDVVDDIVGKLEGKS